MSSKKYNLLLLSLVFTTSIFSACRFNKSDFQHKKDSGLDHIGITVPDMDKAISFFTKVMGFKKVNEIGPFKLDSASRNIYHVHAGSNPERIVTMTTESGSSIELFQFSGTQGNKVQSFQDDINWYHISFYTANIDSSVAVLEKNDIKILTHINHTISGPKAGESWVYFLSPWGTQMELNSYPLKNNL